MLPLAQIANKLAAGDCDALLRSLYGGGVAAQQKRYAGVLEAFTRRFPGHDEAAVFSTPGRTEVGGNHTDHNGGHILAAAVDLDIVGVAAPNGTREVRVLSEGFDEVCVSLDDLAARVEEKYTSHALVRGVMARMAQLGHKTGGFDCVLHSTVLKGSGLSSSAAFEVQMCTIANCFFNGGTIGDVENAQIAQYAENEYFGKPCGLMDMTTCAVGGLVTIDFFDFDRPDVCRVEYDFFSSGYVMFIVDTGGNHADMTPDYEALEHEMKAVAAALGADVLRRTSKAAMIKALPALREKLNDRAILRAFHFFNDDQRVIDQVAALKADDFETFKRLIIESGLSSFTYCQNIYANTAWEDQGLSIALALSEELLSGKGAWRVHGGGFGGTIQAFVPQAMAGEYEAAMSAVFGPAACHKVMLRPQGTQMVLS